MNTRLFLILGSVALAIGVLIVGVNYSRDFDCVDQLMCHGDGGLTATTADRLAAALGFGSEQPGVRSGDDLPSPVGTMAAVAGIILVAGAVITRLRTQPMNGTSE